MDRAVRREEHAHHAPGAGPADAAPALTINVPTYEEDLVALKLRMQLQFRKNPAELEQFKAEDLANTCWALARLDVRGDYALTEAVASRMVVAAPAPHRDGLQLEEFTAQGMANTLWALAKMEARKPPPKPIFPRDGVFKVGDWREWLKKTPLKQRIEAYKEAVFPGDEFAKDLTDQTLT